MTLHLVGLPHTMTTREFDQCAYTAKVRKACGMFRAEGHRVVLYAGEDNEADVDEHVVCISAGERDALFGGGQVQQVSWDRSQPGWRLFNGRAISEIKARMQERDIICLITGLPHLELIEAFPFPEHVVVEFGVGYSGVAAPFQVYESYAWMHAVYGQRFGAMEGDGRFFDAVIPNYYEADEFVLGAGDGGYLAFMSRMTYRKGFEVAIQVAERVGMPLKIAGVAGDTWPKHDHVEYVGLLDADERNTFLGAATATLMPTLYIEPFGGVAAESMLCGTPVIATDWGAFTETVQQGVDGYRCRTMSEFMDAVLASPALDRGVIRGRACGRFLTDVIGPQYAAHFDRLDTLWGDGFYEGAAPLTATVSSDA